METWKAISGYESLYEVSDYGRIRSFPREGTRGRILNGSKNTGGYIQVILSNDGVRRVFRVHALVLREFVGLCPSGKECCHSNGVRADNRLENLRYDTKPANYADRRKHATANDHERNGRAKLDSGRVREIRRLSNKGESGTAIASMFGVSRRQVSRVARGSQWKVA